LAHHVQRGKLPRMLCSQQICQVVRNRKVRLRGRDLDLHLHLNLVLVPSTVLFWGSGCAVGPESGLDRGRGHRVSIHSLHRLAARRTKPEEICPQGEGRRRKRPGLLAGGLGLPTDCRRAKVHPGALKQEGPAQDGEKGTPHVRPADHLVRRGVGVRSLTATARNPGIVRQSHVDVQSQTETDARSLEDVPRASGRLLDGPRRRSRPRVKDADRALEDRSLQSNAARHLQRHHRKRKSLHLSPQQHLWKQTCPSLLRRLP